MRSTLENLIALYKNSDNNLLDDIQASWLLTMLMTRDISAASHQKEASRLPEYIVDVRFYIIAHYTEQITQDVLSKTLSVNKFSQNLFKRYM